MMRDERFEQLGGGVEVCVSKAHTFGSDAILLSNFAKPKSYDRCIDLCSGCGIVPLLWDHPLPVTAVDIQPDAIGQMKLSKPEGRIIPVLADLREPSALGHAAFDLVTCNPPYRAVGTGIISGRHSDRLARHETTCTLEDVCRAAAYLLRSGGRFCLCHLPERLADLLVLMRQYALEPKRVQFVQQRTDSAPWLVLAEGKRGAKPFLTVEAPVIMENQNTRFNAGQI